jgi:ribosomal protein L32
MAVPKNKVSKTRCYNKHKVQLYSFKKKYSLVKSCIYCKLLKPQYIYSFQLGLTAKICRGCINNVLHQKKGIKQSLLKKKTIKKI